jgi:hypothetical protein
MKKIEFFKEKPKKEDLDLEKVVKTSLIVAGSALLIGTGIKLFEDL